MYDKISTVGESVIQHGKSNDRIYLMELAGGDVPDIINELENLCVEKSYSKIIAKVPEEKVHIFEENGYLQEAHIPGYYNGKSNAAIVAKYFNRERQRENNQELINEILSLARKKARKNFVASDVAPLSIGTASTADEAEQMSLVYKEVFDSYPFPIHNPEYLHKTMNNHVQYFYVREGNRFVALSSAEMNHNWGNVEMTDFATLPEYQGKGLAICLLQTMEKVMRVKGFKTAYTIARALSAGMNITFSKMGYTYSGTLTNNTNISGNIESMNIWYKKLC